MATYPTSPDGKWMMTPNGWVFLDSDPTVTPDGEWNVLDGRFVHARRLTDEAVDGSVHLAGDLAPNQRLDQALVQTRDSVIMGDLNVTVNQGPSMDQIKHLFVELLSQVGASTFQTPAAVSEADKQLISERISTYDQLISDGAASDPSISLMVATAANAKGDYDDARRRLAEILQTHPDSPEASDAIQVLAQISMRLGQWRVAEEWAKQAMARFEESENWPALGHTLLKMGQIFANKKEHQRALQMYDAAIDIAKERKLQHLYGRTLANRGMLLHEIGRSMDAKEALSKSLQFGLASNDTAGVLSIKKLLSDIYFEEGDRVTAARLLRESRADMSQTDDKFTQAQRVLFEAEIQRKMNNLRMARDHYKRAERMFFAIGANNKQGEICIQLGDLDNDEDNFDSAIIWYTKALECFHDETKQADRMYCLAELGSLYFYTKNIAESVNNCSLAVELAIQLEDYEQQLSSMLTLCMAKCAENDIAGARKILISAENLAKKHQFDDERLSKLGSMLASTQR